MKIDASRLLLYRAAVVNADKELPSIAESSIAKCFANEIAREVTGKCVQLMGGYGYSKELPYRAKNERCLGVGNSRWLNRYSENKYSISVDRQTFQSEKLS